MHILKKGLAKAKKAMDIETALVDGENTGTDNRLAGCSVDSCNPGHCCVLQNRAMLQQFHYT